MSDIRNIDGHFSPAAHPGWGGFAEELFHYTSRYYKTTEAFLRSLAGDSEFSMSGYKAASLSMAQRDLMAAVLSCAPDAASASALVSIVNTVVRGDKGADASLLERYGERLEHLPKHETVEQRTHFDSEGVRTVGPVDPFLSLADRLMMPVVVRDRHVEVSLRDLATHLDSTNSTLRANLHNAIIGLHSAGYVLRNHPHLTHGEADGVID